MRLHAQHGLTVEVDIRRGAVRAGLSVASIVSTTAGADATDDDLPDWLGQGSATGPGTSIRCDSASGTVDEGIDDLGGFTGAHWSAGGVRRSVRAYPDRPLAVFRTEAMTALTGLATGIFDRPGVGWPVFTPADRTDGAAPEGLRALAYQLCEFALPVVTGQGLGDWEVLPIRPSAGWPLLLAADSGALLLAPLGAFHDQVIGLGDGTIRCGWQGDLEDVPAGFCTELALVAGPDPRACLDAWGGLIRERAGTVRPGRWADALASRPSYWTDNGAAYWYRTEPGLDPAGSLVAAVQDLRVRDVPLGAVQLDSWFYPHAEPRPFDTDEWFVPPTAMLAWEERPDVLPLGVGDLRARLGNPPLVAHIRHLSAEAPIAAELPTHLDPPYAAPATPETYERWLDQCVTWGVETLEHDWLVETFFGVRGLRERPGRAQAWQEGLDRAARERGITLQWSMGTPADLAQTVTLTQVTSVRTCGDHGYLVTPGQLWAWFCTTNALARSLGLMPFKDVFRTDPGIAGETAEPEALLAALSTGPVALGDRVGLTDRDLVLRTCRADGVLVKPDVPIAATAATMMADTANQPGLLVAECFTDHPAGRWSYVVATVPVSDSGPLSGRVVFAGLGDSAPSGAVVVWDWRTGAATRAGREGSLPVTLAEEEWVYLVLAPVLDCGLAVVGDVSKFVTAGDARLEVTDTGAGVRLVVKGAGETVTITGWAERPPRVAGTAVAHDADTGIWTLTARVPPRGWVVLELEA